MKPLLFVATVAGLLAIEPQTHAADYPAQVEALIPRLADADVPARYAAQMELQDLASDASRPGNESARLALGKVLADAAADPAVAQPARSWIVRQLEYMGGEEAVPALDGLLSANDAELRESARRALEKNPSRAATQALAECLGAAFENDAEARWRIGLIHALGERLSMTGPDSDYPRRPALVKHIEPALHDPATALAAAQALGRIGGPEAIEALLAVMNQSPAASLALVEAGRRAGVAGGEALRAVYQRSTFGPARAAALSALAAIDPNATSERIKAALDGNDPFLRQAALNVAEGLGTAYMPVLAGMLPYLAPGAAVQVIGRLDASVEPALIQAVNDRHDAVRRMAIERLGEVGSAASIGVLLRAATDDRPGANEARTALTRVRGSTAAEALEEAAAESAPPLRVAALEALVARESAASLPLLLECAAERDLRISRAALQGLGRMGGAAELLPVARVALDRQTEEAFAALVDIAGRVEDGSASSRALLELAAGRDRASMALLDALGTLGGPEALEAVTSFLDGPHAEKALRALGRWPDLSGAEPLLKLARDEDASAERHSLALNGALTVIGASSEAPAEERAEAVLAAWAATRDVAEKKRVLATMAQVPHTSLIPTIKSLFEEAELKAEAAAAAVALADGLFSENKEAAVDLARAVEAAEPSEGILRRARGILRR